mmetsp:Transcript_3126/g.8716  ORF Transcript_3126/g.8716 Transcript_3126/m.8716 type:complete len:200 (-) Transcript_3126:1333-1932(-)
MCRRHLHRVHPLAARGRRRSRRARDRARLQAQPAVRPLATRAEAPPIHPGLSQSVGPRRASPLLRASHRFLPRIRRARRSARRCSTAKYFEETPSLRLAPRWRPLTHCRSLREAPRLREVRRGAESVALRHRLDRPRRHLQGDLRVGGLRLRRQSLKGRHHETDRDFECTLETHFRALAQQETLALEICSALRRALRSV